MKRLYYSFGATDKLNNNALREAFKMIIKNSLVFRLYIGVVLVLFWSVVALSVEKPPRGAVVTLIKGNTEKQFAELLRRNKSIYKYMWKNASAIATSGPNPDVVLFYEKISSNMKKYIQKATPHMPITFKKIKFEFGIFEKKQAKLINPLCPPTEGSLIFQAGYHHMCRFWFIGFLDYVREYDWVFRLDADCQLLTDVTTVIPDRLLAPSDVGHHRHVLVASPAWMNLLLDGADGINRTSDGEVVRGMGAFVRDFDKRYGLSRRSIDSWYAPYTNAVFINTKWLRAHQSAGATSVGGKVSQQEVVRLFMKEVDESNCIYTNRWGDLPLWGAVLALLDHSVHMLPVPYYHGTHEQIVDSSHAMKNMLTFGMFSNASRSSTAEPPKVRIVQTN